MRFRRRLVGQMKRLCIKFGGEGDRFLARDGQRAEVETVADHDILEIGNVVHRYPSPIATGSDVMTTYVYVNVRRC
jgi:hypothetical protein